MKASYFFKLFISCNPIQFSHVKMLHILNIFFIPPSSNMSRIYNQFLTFPSLHEKWLRFFPFYQLFTPYAHSFCHVNGTLPSREIFASNSNSQHNLWLQNSLKDMFWSLFSSYFFVYLRDDGYISIHHSIRWTLHTFAKF